MLPLDPGYAINLATWGGGSTVRPAIPLWLSSEHHNPNRCAQPPSPCHYPLNDSTPWMPRALLP